MDVDGVLGKLHEPRWLERLPRRTRRIVAGVLGGLALLAAALASPFPGPWSIPLVIGGVVVLAWEFGWARRLRRWTVAKVQAARSWDRGKSGVDVRRKAVRAGAAAVLVAIFGALLVLGVSRGTY